MLFGKERVSNKVHLISTFLVAAGTTVSAFWILSLNSWMQTPDGFSIVDGKFFAEDWLAIIFNPSFPYRFIHVFLASLLTSALLIAGISAWRCIKGVEGPATMKVLKTGIVMVAVLAPMQMFTGDSHGLNTLEHQPAKVAAIEGLWETQESVPLTLFGWPDEEQKTTHYAVKVPKAGSLILTHTLDGEVKGLNEFESVHPPVALVFWSFRVMVGVGLLMLLVSWWGLWTLYRKASPSKPLLSALSLMTFSGWVATLAGWYVTEVGRQPWIVQGVLRTAEVVADHPPTTLLGTVIGYAALYAFLLFSYIATLHYMASKPAESLVLLRQDSSQTGPSEVDPSEGGV
jgi:cytochrome d ubiquinol oxidase subunit I